MKLAAIGAHQDPDSVALFSPEVHEAVKDGVVNVGVGSGEGEALDAEAVLQGVQSRRARRARC